LLILWPEVSAQGKDGGEIREFIDTHKKKILTHKNDFASYHFVREHIERVSRISRIVAEEVQDKAGVMHKDFADYAELIGLLHDFGGMDHREYDKNPSIGPIIREFNNGEYRSIKDKYKAFQREISDNASLTDKEKESIYDRVLQQCHTLDAIEEFKEEQKIAAIPGEGEIKTILLYSGKGRLKEWNNSTYKSSFLLTEQEMKLLVIILLFADQYDNFYNFVKKGILPEKPSDTWDPEKASEDIGKLILTDADSFKKEILKETGLNETEGDVEDKELVDIVANALYSVVERGVTSDIKQEALFPIGLLKEMCSENCGFVIDSLDKKGNRGNSFIRNQVQFLVAELGDSRRIAGLVEKLGRIGIPAQVNGRDLTEMTGEPAELAKYIVDNTSLRYTEDIKIILQARLDVTKKARGPPERFGSATAAEDVYASIFDQETLFRGNKTYNIVLFRGGRGASALAKLLKTVPGVAIKTILGATDDGRSWYVAAQEFNATGMPDCGKSLLDLAQSMQVKRFLETRMKGGEEELWE
jgi:hypothetical protein